MNELAMILNETNPERWKALKLLPRDQYDRIMLSLDITDAVMDYIVQDKAWDIKEFALYLDRIVIKFHKR